MWKFLRDRLAASRNAKKTPQTRFAESWLAENKHNGTCPVSIFPKDVVQVGNHSYGELNVLYYKHQTDRERLVIGNFVSISTDVKFILDGNHQSRTFTTFPLRSMFLGGVFPEDSMSKGSITVEDEVWIGNRATILSGVKLGKGSIIAAGALVTEDVAPYSIVAGVPARHLRFRIPETLIPSMLPLRLDDLPREIILAHLDLFYRELDEATANQLVALFGQQSSLATLNKSTPQ